ncbi:E3 ubiquitin--protein ligase, partial [Klebsiella pneumoniae]|nr:E3 ubiquitin--protein ligase [Klebsiella pneumoniae]
QADAVKQNAKQESDRIVKEAGQIKDNAIGDANQLSAEAASKTKAIQDSIAKDKQNAAPPAAQQ